MRSDSVGIVGHSPCRRRMRLEIHPNIGIKRERSVRSHLAHSHEARYARGRTAPENSSVYALRERTYLGPVMAAYGKAV